MDVKKRFSEQQIIDFLPVWFETVVNSGYAYRFYFGGIAGFAGYQLEENQNSTAAAIAVRNGDITAVPVPVADWLLGSGLLGLIGAASAHYGPHHSKPGRGAVVVGSVPIPKLPQRLDFRPS